MPKSPKKETVQKIENENKIQQKDLKLEQESSLISEKNEKPREIVKVIEEKKEVKSQSSDLDEPKFQPTQKSSDKVLENNDESLQKKENENKQHALDPEKTVTSQSLKSNKKIADKSLKLNSALFFVPNKVGSNNSIPSIPDNKQPQIHVNNENNNEVHSQPPSKEETVLVNTSQVTPSNLNANKTQLEKTDQFKLVAGDAHLSIKFILFMT